MEAREQTIVSIEAIKRIGKRRDHDQEVSKTREAIKVMIAV